MSGPTTEGAPEIETATLAGGCFWCIEAVFSEIHGVESARPGYAGGTTTNPSYEDVCGGRSGHAEALEVRFDPKVLPYAELLRIFFAVHDPTTLNRQGHDVGPQYRSMIFFHSPEQRTTALAVTAEIETAGLYRGKIVTQLVPFSAFYPAEEYHRDYFRRHPEQGYCQAVIAPKLGKFRARFADRLRSPGPVAGAPRAQ
ncbi:MAG: peptide-methionine (S)-S-oxide reductase MsrA [Thermoplasmata archaeon]